MHTFYLLLFTYTKDLPKSIGCKDQRNFKNNSKNFKHIEHIVLEGDFFFVHMGVFFFFLKHIFKHMSNFHNILLDSYFGVNYLNFGFYYECVL
jgi:hypothetical protein